MELVLVWANLLFRSMEARSAVTWARQPRRNSSPTLFLMLRADTELMSSLMERKCLSHRSLLKWVFMFFAVIQKDLKNLFNLMLIDRLWGKSYKMFYSFRGFKKVVHVTATELQVQTPHPITSKHKIQGLVRWPVSTPNIPKSFNL